MSNITNQMIIDRKILTRLFSKITVSIENFFRGTPCWEATCSLSSAGYPRLGFKGKAVCIYKLTYEFFVEITPKGLELDHLCRNRLCVNPSHLEPVTHAVNMGRGIHAIKTHCKHGHALSGKNLIPNKFQQRQCRTCHNRRACAKYHRQNPNARTYGIKNSQKTHCINGHEFTPKNTYISKNGWRQCRRCHVIHETKRRKKH